MKYFDEDIARELEFDQIRHWLSDYAKTDSVREQLAQLKPLKNLKEIEANLVLLHELQQIRKMGLSFPRMEFQELKKEISLLGITDSVIDLSGIINLYDASRFVNDLFSFFKENPYEFSHLEALLSEAYPTQAIEKEIEKILDRRLKIKDDASDNLLQIRQQMQRCKQKINRNFEKALKSAKAAGYIEDLKESFIGNRRVLSIVSSHKRKVGGNILGSSKTGALTYIEPQNNIALNAEYDQLLDDEHKEIRRIFAQLTNFLRGRLSLIQAYDEIIARFDELNAKQKLSEKMDGQMPNINHQGIEIEYVDAFHPVLLINNREQDLDTIPQSFSMDPEGRILVISGPNAGGKSITLKTVGLLQLMFQSALLLPLSSQSTMAYFDYVLCDIGDHQSIQNQLSTYSHRLKRMKFYLDKLGSKTLLLLDEFGTGSDPELGGALAEAFFEHLYDQGCYAVITTHYSNIKLRASQLSAAVNANMSFNRKTLLPEYHLEIGQPGSSFTFEVAKMNGIPKHLIDKAKSKVDDQKIQMDQLISDLQKDKSILKQLKEESYQAKLNMQSSREEYEEKSEHFQERLNRQQKLIDRNNKFLAHGKKMAQFIEEFPSSSKKKQNEYLNELKKYLAIEKSKIEERKKKKRETEKKKAAQQRQNAKNKKARALKKSAQKPIEMGSKVKLKNSKQSGEVVAIDGNEITVIFGQLKAKVKRERLVNL